MTEEKLYRVEINDDNGKLRNVVLTPNAVIQSFSTDAKKIMFELRVTNLQAFNKIQKIIGIRQTNEQQTLWTDEIEKINNWFNNAENLYFFINEYASNHNPLLGTPLNIKIGKIKKSDVNDYIIDNPISHNKYDFEKRQPRTIANQNLLRFKHSFYNYIMSMYSTEEKQVDWKMTKYSSEISEYIAYKFMELGYLGLNFEITNKLFNEFTNSAYNNNEKFYKETIKNTVQKIQNKKLLVRDKKLIADLLFNIGIKQELINPTTYQLTEKGIEYIKIHKQN